MSGTLKQVSLNKTVENIDTLDINLPQSVWATILHSLIPLPENWPVGNFMLLVHQAYKHHHKKTELKYRCTLLDVHIEVMYLLQRNSMDLRPDIILDDQIWLNVISGSITEKIKRQHFLTEEHSNIVDIIFDIGSEYDVELDYEKVSSRLHDIMHNAMSKNAELTYTNAGAHKDKLWSVLSEMLDELKDQGQDQGQDDADEN